MPTRIRDDGTPIITFDAILEVSPFALFKRLQQDRAPLLVDVREVTGRHTLHGAINEPDPDWTPSDLDAEVVLFDDDGSTAVAAAQRLQQAGYGAVKALFGGLELYRFALDPDIVESDTFLRTER